MKLMTVSSVLALVSVSSFAVDSNVLETADAEMSLRKNAPLLAKDIHMRDPFVVTDAERGRYFLLSSCFADNGEKPGDGFRFLGTGAKIYESEDLVHFKPAKMVLEIPRELDCRAFWAPEMHRYRDKWYVFGTINYGTPRKKSARGTWTFVADGPEGPFRPASKRPITPEGWFALDGTLWVEDGKPHMVFCHEWLQTGVGEMCEVEMTEDLSAPVGEPRTLFRATDFLAKPPKGRRESVVTDGPFLYRSPKSGKLFMTWSNAGRNGAYLVILSESASGRLEGPWGKHRVIFDKDGGHGMIFRRLDGSLAFALHSPNKTPQERPKFFDVIDTGDTLEIGEFDRSRPTPVWADEFNGPQLDTNLWQRIGPGGCDWDRHMSKRPDLVELRDGCLVLVGTRNSDTNADPRPYLTGGVWNKHADARTMMTYGRVEIRAKFENAKGAWPAFWMMPKDRDAQGRGWPWTGEIDIVERLNGDPFVWQTVHSGWTKNGHADSPPSHKKANIRPGEFNVYGLERTPKAIIWSVNGTETFRYERKDGGNPDQWPFTTPFYLLLDMQLGGEWVGKVNASDLPVRTWIDWVRVYGYEANPDGSSRSLNTASRH